METNPQPVNQHEIVTLTTPSNPNHKILLIGLTTMVIIGITIGTVYYLQINQQEIASIQNIQQAPKISQTIAQPLPTSISSAVVAPSNHFKIVTGNLYKTLPNGKEELIIPASSLKHTQLEVIEIVSFILSPDTSKIVLRTFGGISPFVLFYYDISTGQNTFISFGEEVAWSPNSRYIAYTHRSADVGPLRLSIFDTTANKHVETTQSVNAERSSFTDIRWSPQSDFITAKYETRDDIPYGNIVAQGDTQITLKH